MNGTNGKYEGPEVGSAFCTQKAPEENSPPVGRRSKLDMYLPTMHWRGSA